MVAGNSPGLFNRSAAVTKPEGAPVADDLLKAKLLEDVISFSDLPSYAVGRPLEGYSTTALCYLARELSKYPN